MNGKLTANDKNHKTFVSYVIARFKNICLFLCPSRKFKSQKRKSVNLDYTYNLIIASQDIADRSVADGICILRFISLRRTGTWRILIKTGNQYHAKNPSDCMGYTKLSSTKGAPIQVPKIKEKSRFKASIFVRTRLLLRI